MSDFVLPGSLSALKNSHGPTPKRVFGQHRYSDRLSKSSKKPDLVRLTQTLNRMDEEGRLSQQLAWHNFPQLFRIGATYASNLDCPVLQPRCVHEYPCGSAEFQIAADLFHRR